MSGVESAGAVDDGGCPVGEQPIFGPAGDLVCGQIPAWPPESTGSRSAPGRCIITDGTYEVSWHSDIDEQLRPAFSVTRALTIAGDTLTLDGYDYRLDWVDSSSANVWKPGDTDTLEFRIHCETSDVIVGSYTLNLPYPNPGHQVETWTLEARSPVCGEMSCHLVICFACPTCVHERPVCYCGYSEDPTYQSEKPLRCACWERISDIPPELADQTACSYTPPEGYEP